MTLPPFQLRADDLASHTQLISRSRVVEPCDTTGARSKGSFEARSPRTRQPTGLTGLMVSLANCRLGSVAVAVAQCAGFEIFSSYDAACPWWTRLAITSLITVDLCPEKSALRLPSQSGKTVDDDQRNSAAETLIRRARAPIVLLESHLPRQARDRSCRLLACLFAHTTDLMWQL